jgi:hypothetical protein
MQPYGEIKVSFWGETKCYLCSSPGGGPFLWQFVFTGTDDRGEAVRLEFEARLPVAQ